MLGNLRISSKLLVMVGLSVVGILAVVGVGLAALRDNLLEDHAGQTPDVVLLARQAVDLDYRGARKARLRTPALERGKALLRSLRFGKDDYFYAFNQQTGASAPSRRSRRLYNAPDSDGVFFTRAQIELAAKGGGFIFYRFPRVGADTPLPKISYAVEFKPYDWTIGGGIYLDDIDAIFWSQVWRIGALVGAALLLVVGMSLLLGRSILQPIAGMTAAMRKIAEGDTATAIPARERGDEVGALAQSVQIFKAT